MAPPTQDVRVLALQGVPSPFPAVRREMATRAMQRFTCTGIACPDTCCRDFGIAIDRPSLQRMLVATARDPVDHERIVRLVVLSLPSDASASDQTYVPLNEDGVCPLLESSGNCGIHRKYGEAALSDTCSVFPRTSLLVEDRLEITGTLACPELARLTLLTADGLLQEPTTESLLPRSYVGTTVEADDDYAAQFLRVRETLIHLFGLANFPLGSRLIFAAHLAAQLDDFFRRGTVAFAGPRRLFANQRLVTELAAAVDEASLEGLHRDLRAVGGTTEAVVGAAASLLIERQCLPHAPRFAALLKAVFESLQGPTCERGDVAQTLAPGALAALIAQRRERLERRLPGLADRILARYCRHFVLRHSYTNASSLLNYLGRMALSVAAIRLLLLGSPELLSLLDADANPDSDEARFSAIAVGVIQIFTKAVSHQGDFLATVQRANEDGEGVTFGRLVLFAKFI